jgi:hypothetical protein
MTYHTYACQDRRSSAELGESATAALLIIRLQLCAVDGEAKAPLTMSIADTAAPFQSPSLEKHAW